MQSAYSMYGSRLHLVLEDEVADAYNRCVDAFLEAQEVHKERTGIRWNPKTEPIWINWNEEDQQIYEKIGNIINLLAEVNGGGLDIPEEEITSDYLVKL